jgi:hypothetical protein
MVKIKGKDINILKLKGKHLKPMTKLGDCTDDPLKMVWFFISLELPDFTYDETADLDIDVVYKVMEEIQNKNPHLMK